MKNVPPEQYTIKGIPQSVNHYLQEKARQENKSLNQVILECLQHSLDATKTQRRRGNNNFSLASDANDAKMAKEAEYLDILDADPSI